LAGRIGAAWNPFAHFGKRSANSAAAGGPEPKKVRRRWQTWDAVIAVYFNPAYLLLFPLRQTCVFQPFVVKLLIEGPPMPIVRTRMIKNDIFVM